MRYSKLIVPALALSLGMSTAVFAQSKSTTSGGDNYGYGSHLTPDYRYSAPRSPSYDRRSESGWGNAAGPYADTPTRPRGPVTDPRLTGYARALDGGANLGTSTLPSANTQLPATSGIAQPSGTLSAP